MKFSTVKGGEKFEEEKRRRNWREIRHAKAWISCHMIVIPIGYDHCFLEIDPQRELSMHYVKLETANVDCSCLCRYEKQIEFYLNALCILNWWSQKKNGDTCPSQANRPIPNLIRFIVFYAYSRGCVPPPPPPWQKVNTPFCLGGGLSACSSGIWKNFFFYCLSAQNFAPIPRQKIQDLPLYCIKFIAWYNMITS